MELNVLNLQDSGHGERRQRIRHKLHSPIFASFVGIKNALLSDSNQIVDLHEDGFLFRTKEAIEVNQPMNVCLELPQTNSFVHGSGHVIWLDQKGMGGFRLSRIDDSSRQLLKEWLFQNQLVACANHSARQGQRDQLAMEQMGTRAVPDLSGLLSAVEAVRREIGPLGGDLDAVLQMVTERALSFTAASGAALAFVTDGEMICRGRAGDPAPPKGTLVDAKHGLSGECIRSGRTISCVDVEMDPRVDREICRSLGIGSVLAVPIFSDFRVTGLLEVFSDHPHAFTKAHETVLERLAELVPGAMSAGGGSGAMHDSPALAETKPAPVSTTDAVGESEAGEPLRGIPVRLSHIVVLVAALAITFLALGYVSAPFIWRRIGLRPSKVEAAETDTSSARNALALGAKSPEELRKLAEQGDAEAEWLLGVHYHTGDGVPQDDGTAAQWFTRSAEQGHITAQATLGAYYWAGRGVPQDLSKAYFWSVLARAGNDEASKYRVAVLTARMSRSQVAAAQQQAEEWIRQHSGIAKTSAAR